MRWCIIDKCLLTCEWCWQQHNRHKLAKCCWLGLEQLRGLVLLLVLLVLLERHRKG
jgi:hypothetical protein